MIFTTLQYVEFISLSIIKSTITFINTVQQL